MYYYLEFKSNERGEAGEKVSSLFPGGFTYGLRREMRGFLRRARVGKRGLSWGGGGK